MKDIKTLNHLELIEYCRELEGELIEFKQNDSKILEYKLTELVQDIYSSSIDEINADNNSIRFKETNRIDFKNSLENLKTYIEDFSKENRFNLNG